MKGLDILAFVAGFWLDEKHTAPFGAMHALCLVRHHCTPSISEVLQMINGQQLLSLF